MSDLLNQFTLVLDAALNVIVFTREPPVYRSTRANATVKPPEVFHLFTMRLRYCCVGLRVTFSKDPSSFPAVAVQIVEASPPAPALSLNAMVQPPFSFTMSQYTGNGVSVPIWIQ